jgi:transcriptional regulator with XRE-family HTH domain
MKQFGRYLRELREKSGKRIKDLANEVEWTSVYVSDIELGRRNPPSPQKIRQIAAILGADPKTLLDLADREKKRVVLDLDEESPDRMEVALMLARSWDGLDDEEIRDMKTILNRRLVKSND